MCFKCFFIPIVIYFFVHSIKRITNRLSWKLFMESPKKQLLEENSLFGHKVPTTLQDKTFNFRKEGDQGSPADTLGGMGIRMADVGSTGFNYQEDGFPLVPENDFPYRQVLDKTSEFVTIQYNNEEGFKIIDRTWLEQKAVNIKLGKQTVEGPVCYSKGYIDIDRTFNIDAGTGYNGSKKYIDDFDIRKKN